MQYFIFSMYTKRKRFAFRTISMAKLRGSNAIDSHLVYMAKKNTVKGRPPLFYEFQKFRFTDDFDAEFFRFCQF